MILPVVSDFKLKFLMADTKQEIPQQAGRRLCSVCAKSIRFPRSAVILIPEIQLGSSRRNLVIVIFSGR